MKLKNVLNPIYVIKNKNLIKPALDKRWKVFFGFFQSRIRALGIPITDNDRKLAALKDKHKGKRCFVLGNGPSLRISDLDKLKGEITIASNKIYLAFDQTEWRPTYYTVIDSLVVSNITKEIMNLQLSKIFPRWFQDEFGKDVNAMFVDIGIDWVDVGNFRPGFSADIRDKVYAGECVTYFNIQLAYYMGCREIYLIGVDFSFLIPDKKIPDKGFEYILESNEEQNHFIKGYRPVGEKWTMPHLREQEMAFMYSKEYMDRHGGKVYNASRKTELKTFERVDFDLLFSKKI